MFDASLNGTPIIPIGAANDNGNAVGDFDILDTDGLTITGNGESNTIIDGNASEAIFSCRWPVK